MGAGGEYYKFQGPTPEIYDKFLWKIRTRFGSDIDGIETYHKSPVSGEEQSKFHLISGYEHGASEDYFIEPNECVVKVSTWSQKF